MNLVLTLQLTISSEADLGRLRDLRAALARQAQLHPAVRDVDAITLSAEPSDTRLAKASSLVARASATLARVRGSAAIDRTAVSITRRLLDRAIETADGGLVDASPAGGEGGT